MIGKSIVEMRVREKYGLNIVAIHNLKDTKTDIDPHYQMTSEDTMVVIGKRKNVSDFIDDYSA